MNTFYIYYVNTIEHHIALTNLLLCFFLRHQLKILSIKPIKTFVNDRY